MTSSPEGRQEAAVEVVEALRSLLALAKLEFRGDTPPRLWSRAIAKADAALQAPATPDAQTVVEK